MRLVDRWISAGLVAVGLILIIISQMANVSDQTQSTLLFSGVDCLLFSIIGLYFPRSNHEVKHQAINFLQFAVLAVATFAAVALLVFIVFGSPSPIGEEVFTTALTLGFTSALIIPVIAKQLTLKVRTKQ